MSSQNRWEFLIEGGSYPLLNSMCSYSNSVYFQIYEELDFMNDCSVQDYRFRSIYCDDEDDVDTVWQIGYELVSLFNGANKFLDNNSPKIRIEQLWLNRTRQKFCGNRKIFALLGKPHISEEALLSTLQRHQPFLNLKLLARATEDESFYALLKYFDMEQSWTTYYKILESVEEWAKEKGQKLDIEHNERNRFTAAANNYSMTGIDSRHGFKEKVKKYKKEPMQLNEAHDFIRSAVEKYIQAFL